MSDKEQAKPEGYSVCCDTTSIFLTNGRVRLNIVKAYPASEEQFPEDLPEVFIDDDGIERKDGLGGSFVFLVKLDSIGTDVFNCTAMIVSPKGYLRTYAIGQMGNYAKFKVQTGDLVVLTGGIWIEGKCKDFCCVFRWTMKRGFECRSYIVV